MAIVLPDVPEDRPRLGRETPDPWLTSREADSFGALTQ